MTVEASRKTGLLGPVAVFGGVLLLLAAPIMRGGNRYLALIPLEMLGLVVLSGVWMRWLLVRPQPEADSLFRRLLLLLLAASPLLIALVQLLPLPADTWAALPGHSIYVETLKAAGATTEMTRPLSLAPLATAASMLAGIPIVAGLLLGYMASMAQLRLILWAVVAMAFAQVLLGLLQVAGGEHSQFFFGVMTFGPPVGSFANRNHFANYLAMALVAYAWLAYENLRGRGAPNAMSAFTTRHRLALWGTGAMVLVLGILMSRSRGGALFGLPAAMLALAAISLRMNGLTRGLRLAGSLLVVLIVAAVALLGYEAATSRVTMDQLASSAGFRSALARTSFEGGMAFWPWGSGWGTFDMVYPRFQPASLPGFANHAHMDYVQMLFEGGILFVAFAIVFAWLAIQRAIQLAARAVRERRLGREAMAAAICGLGLLGLLLHSLVEFNMRIPANAILGAVLAGAYLRPLNRSTRHRSRASKWAHTEPSSEFDSQRDSGTSR